jgi:4-hydroxybenzoate polyprenyltransferase
MWWGVLILPYLIGWSMGIWGPGAPRWLLVSGIGVSLWYLVIVAKVLRHSKQDSGLVVVMVIALTSLLTIAGCIGRLTKRIPRPS